MAIDVIAMLRCPSCGGGLRRTDEGAICVSCGERIPSDGQALRFVAHTSGHAAEGKSDSLIVRLKNAFKRYPRFYMFLVYAFGTSNAGIAPQTFVKRWLRPDQVVVNLGAGTQAKPPNAVHVDMVAFPGIDVLADIGRLPFASGCVDAVICQSVLEHVPDPHAVVREAIRILKPGGLVYVTVPFMFPYHSSPDDYRRWTLDGLRAMMREVEEKRSGLRHGPTTALLLLFVHWVATILSFGVRTVHDIILVIGTCITAPIAHVIDFPLNRLKMSEDIASGFYLIGRKRM